jgi:hypothetical protein
MNGTRRHGKVGTMDSGPLAGFGASFHSLAAFLVQIESEFLGVAFDFFVKPSVHGIDNSVLGGGILPGMARKVRVGFEGAIYRVINRGDRQEAIFLR